MRYKNYIWDFDGTLYDTYEVLTNALMQSLKEFGYQANRLEVYQAMKRESVRFVAEKFGGQHKKQAIMDRTHEIENSLIDQPKLFDDTRETLQKLSEQGAKHFLLTHRDEQAISFLEQDSLVEYFTDFVTVSNQFPLKPNPKSLLYLVEKHQLDKKETVMIGDRKLDILAGKNAGVSSILYDIDGFLGEIPADFVVHQLRMILNIEERGKP